MLFDYTFNGAGDYSFQIVFADDNDYNGSESEVKNILVNKINTDLDLTINGDAKINKTIRIIGTLIDTDGNYLVGKLVNLIVNGQIVASEYTDNNGQVQFNYTFDKSGDYNFQLAVTENDNYNATESEVQNIIVNKINTALDLAINGDAKVNETIKLVAKLSYNPGIAGEEIIFTLNGKLIGSALSNSEGIATFVYTIPNAGIYNFSAEYMGNDVFMPSSTLLDIIVEEEPTPTPTPTQIPDPSDDTANSTETNNNKTSNNPAATAAMKNTGMPIIAILIVLLSSLGLVISRKK